MPTDLTDDQLAEALADAWIEQAFRNPVMRREALRAAGLLPEPVQMTLAEISRQCGVSEGTISHMVRMFKARLAARIRSDPNSPPSLLSATNSYLSKL